MNKPDQFEPECSAEPRRKPGRPKGSGRKSTQERLSMRAWRHACQGAANAGLQALVAARIMETPDHPAFLHAWGRLVEQGYGRPRQQIDLVAFNPATLTDEQLARITSGESPLDVLGPSAIEAEFVASEAPAE